MVNPGTQILLATRKFRLRFGNTDHVSGVANDVMIDPSSGLHTSTWLESLDIIAW